MPKRTTAEKTKLLSNFALDVVDICMADISKTRALHAVDAVGVKTSSLTPNMHWYFAIWVIMICAENIL